MVQEDSLMVPDAFLAREFWRFYFIFEKSDFLIFWMIRSHNLRTRMVP